MKILKSSLKRSKFTKEICHSIYSFFCENLDPCFKKIILQYRLFLESAHAESTKMEKNELYFAQRRRAGLGLQGTFGD